VLVFLSDRAADDPPVLHDRLHTEHVSVRCSEPIDLLAVVAGSQWGVTDSSSLLAMAIGFQRPYQALQESRSGPLGDLAEWIGKPDLITDRPSSLLAGADLAAARSQEAESLDRLVDVIDVSIDDLAAELRRSPGRRAVATVPQRLRDLRERVAVLEAAHAALRERMDYQRLTVGRLAQDLSSGGSSSPPPPGDQTTVPDADVRVLRLRCEQAERELAAIYATKTMRLLKPARETYRRLRSRNR
jgi:hypothetical protein